MIPPKSPLWRLDMLGELRLVRLGEPDGAAPDGAAPDAGKTHFRSRKTAGLLAFLTLRRGMHRRGVLGEMFWPDTDSHGARGSLRVALSSLRTLLEPEGIAHGTVLLVAGESIGISSALGSDVEAFQSELKMAQRAPDAGQKHAALHRALEWYRGPLVVVDEIEGLMAEADGLEEDFVRAQGEVLAGLEGRGQFQLALELARLGAKKAPWHEALALDVLRLAARESRSEAARDFKKWCARAEKNGVSVSPVTLQRAREWERAAVGARGITSAPGASPIKGLGGSWTSFFGREAEIIALQRALSGGTRLITLTGTAGVGKSRLAEQVARRLALRGEFGLIVWVALAELPVASLLPKALGQSLGLSTRAASAPEGVAMLQHALRQHALRQHALRQTPLANRAVDGARVLLVLDGFEHLCDDGAPLVRAWIEAMPELSCLLTSRRALGFNGEVRHEVLPLETAESGDSQHENLPEVQRPAVEHADSAQMGHSTASDSTADSTASDSTASWSQFPALRAQQSPTESCSGALFLARAQLSRLGWLPSPDDRVAMERLCTRLEGLPLALEIVAARLAWLSPAQLLAEIETSPDALGGGEVDLSGVLNWSNPDRAAHLHHATLRAALAWSERQLPLAVAHFWAQISVFRGGFTLEAASQLCGCEAAPLLMALSEMSLLRFASRGPDLRATQLEIARQYAKQSLSEAERAELEEKHARYFALWLASRPASKLVEAEQLNLNCARAWFARHDPAREPNFQASSGHRFAP